VNAQMPNCIWARSDGGIGQEGGENITSGPNGSVFVIGRFIGSTIVLDTTTLTNTSGQDIFIVRYDQSGQVLWANSGSGYSFSHPAISSDTSGNLFITGGFYFGDITFGNTNLINAGNTDIYVVKFDSLGNVLWARGIGTTETEIGESISTDRSGNVYVSGTFGGPYITFGTTTLYNTNSTEMFVVKYDPSGNVVWAKSPGGSAASYGRALSTDAIGNVYVTGSFHGPNISFDSITLGTGAFQNGIVFVVKYDSAGNALWARSGGGNDLAFGKSICTDSNANVILTGGFLGTNISFGSTILTNRGDENIFVAKYDAVGNFLWARSAGGSQLDRVYDISVDQNENVFIAGTLYSDTFKIENKQLIKVGNGNPFFAKYDPLGNLLWANSTGGPNSDYAFGICNDNNGNIFFTGAFESPTLTIANTTISNAGLTDMFVAKLSETTSNIEIITSHENINFYPNPCSSQTWLQSGKYLTNVSIIIKNYLGQSIKELKDLSGNNLNIPTHDLENGFYLIHLVSGNKTIGTAKLLVEN